MPSRTPPRSDSAFPTGDPRTAGTACRRGPVGNTGTYGGIPETAAMGSTCRDNAVI
jgi:hypothetical protein